MLLYLLYVIGALIALLLLYAALRPAQRSISRSLIIAARPETLFPYINNGKKSFEWMPWKDSDPGVTMQYSGPAEGVGASSAWVSSGKMGIGNAVIVASVLNKSVQTQLTYTKPVAMSQLAEISLEPVTSGTKVTWSVNCHNGFFFRLIGLFVNFDKLVGGEFEKGLRKLKSLTENPNERGLR